MGHCTHIKESDNVQVQNIFNGSNNITCSTNCKYGTAATMFTLETWFCFLYVTINILHKCDNKDNSINKLTPNAQTLLHYCLYQALCLKTFLNVPNAVPLTVIQAISRTKNITSMNSINSFVLVSETQCVFCDTRNDFSYDN